MFQVVVVTQLDDSIQFGNPSNFDNSINSDDSIQLDVKTCAMRSLAQHQGSGELNPRFELSRRAKLI